MKKQQAKQVIENFIRREVRKSLTEEETDFKLLIFKNKFLKLYEEYMNYMEVTYGKSKNYPKFETAFKNFMTVAGLNRNF